MSSSTNSASLPYHEPGIVTILVASSFLLLLNVVNYALDRIVYCGLVGQLFIGIAWGVPGANWLSEDLQHSIVQLGYIGLILIVYEGGLSSNLKAVKANLFLSTAVALTGIAAPMALSFVLVRLLPLSPVQAFAAGAALCSTSLGTTFTVLATSGLSDSRLGVVLTSAAMMDDVVGLVMVQIISSLGANSDFTQVTVIRPVFVSLAFAILVPLICRFMAKPIMIGAKGYLNRQKNLTWVSTLRSSKAALVYQTGLLLAMITGATYAGTSNLFAAYLAGASITWLGDCSSSDKSERSSRTSFTTSRASSQVPTTSQPSDTCSIGPGTTIEPSANNHGPDPAEVVNKSSGKKVYECYYQPAVDLILRPFFFASIGFAIPISKMFTGRVIWRGLVYTILMLFAKIICGLWLIRFGPISRPKAISKKLPLLNLPTFGFAKSNPRSSDSTNGESARANSAKSLHHGSLTATVRQGGSSTAPESKVTVAPTRNVANTTRKRTAIPRPKSLYPAAILGSAMVSRGEIGFLISSLAESNEVFGQGGNTEEFLVVTWAILLCTLIGPMAVGLLVRRVKRLQQAARSKPSSQQDPLGVWGVLPSPGTT